MNESKYRGQEKTRFRNDLKRIHSMPSGEHMQNKMKLKEHLETPGGRRHFLDCVRHVTLGNFGQGCYWEARETIANTKMNRRAWLFTRTAWLEYHLGEAHPRSLWKSLDAKIQDEINAGLDAIINGTLKEMIEESLRN